MSAELLKYITTKETASNNLSRFSCPSFVDISKNQDLTAQAAGVVDTSDTPNNLIAKDSSHVTLTSSAGADLRVYLPDTASVPIGWTVGLTNGANAVEVSAYSSDSVAPEVLSVGTDTAFVTVTSTSISLGHSDHFESLLTDANKYYRATKVGSKHWIIYPMFNAAAAGTADNS